MNDQLSNTRGNINIKTKNVWSEQLVKNQRETIRRMGRVFK